MRTDSRPSPSIPAFDLQLRAPLESIWLPAFRKTLLENLFELREPGISLAL